MILKAGLTYTGAEDYSYSVPFTSDQVEVTFGSSVNGIADTFLWSEIDAENNGDDVPF